MDVNSKPLSSQDNVEDYVMNSAKENVCCICDCGDSSNKCDSVTVDDITNQTFETSDATYNIYVTYTKCVGFRIHKGDTTREKDGMHRRRRFFCNREGKRPKKFIYNPDRNNPDRKREHKALTQIGCETMLSVYFNTKSSI
ncbi:hypothetical protein PIB30_093605 [Stylosanthes scabra]|uniref:FAR1 domain-containing protein n=1 Tax=Stylosanthes scabra TaxID=79078 RepID=A0ABU6QUI5_9FABA|nr:hypothetical protein [Stylosanthes scabra]